MVPWGSLQHSIEALRNGASYRDAAKAAGIHPLKLDVILELGAEGVSPWDEFYSAALQADYLSLERTITKRRDMSEEGHLTAMKQFSQYKDQEQFGLIHGEERAKAPSGLNGGGGQHSLPGGITVQIAQFSPPQKPPELSEKAEQVLDVLPNPLKKELT